MRIINEKDEKARALRAEMKPIPLRVCQPRVCCNMLHRNFKVDYIITWLEEVIII